MPKEEDINLDAPEGLSQEDLDILKRKADELGQVAQSAEKNAETIKEASKILEGKSFAELNILDKTLDTSTGDGDSISKAEMYELIIQILAEQEKAREERKGNEEAIEEIKTTTQQVRETTGGIRGHFGEITSLRRDPKGFGMGKLKGLIGKAGWVGIMANFAMEMGEQVYNQVLGEVKAQFQAGGAWDRRKLVEDELNEYNSIAYLTKVRSGQVYFGADAGQELRQGSPQGSNNTRSLRDGHLRYIQFHGGV